MTYLSPGEKYDLRNFQALESSHKQTVTFGTETISYKGPQIWSLIAKRLRTLATLNKSKKEIKNGSVMPAHAEYAKHTVNMLTLLTKECIVFFSRTPYFFSRILLVVPFLTETSR